VKDHIHSIYSTHGENMIDFISNIWTLVMVVFSLGIFFIWIKEYTKQFMMFVLFIYIAFEFFSELNGRSSWHPLLVLFAVFAFIFLYIKSMKDK